MGRLLAAVRRIPRYFNGWRKRFEPFAARPIATVRVFANPDLKRAYPIYRRKALRTIGRSLAVLVPVTLVLLLLWPPLLLAWLAIGVLVLVAHRVRWSAWGLARRGLPRGLVRELPIPSLDRDYLAKAARRYGPIFSTNYVRRRAVAVYGIARGEAVLREHATALGPVPRPDNFLVEGGFVRNQQGERHRATRAALSIACSAPVVTRASERMSVCIQRGLAEMAAESEAHGTNPMEQAERIGVSVLSCALLGLDPDDPSHDAYVDICRSIDHVYPTQEMLRLRDAQHDVLRGVPSGERPCGYAELQQRSPEALADPVIYGNMAHLVHTASTDLAGLITWTLAFLSQNPEWCTKLRAEQDPSALADRIVSETLRMAQSEFMQREVREPFVLDGHHIPKDWFVWVLVRQSHRDPQIFDDPDRFDPDRFLRNRFDSSQYAPFGVDGRSCVGERLTRTIGALVAIELANRYELEIVHPGHLEFGFYRHWTPGHDFRLRLRPQDIDPGPLASDAASGTAATRGSADAGSGSANE